MRQFRTLGSVRGAPGNRRPYRDRFTGSLHGGLVVVNQSTLGVAGSTPAEIAGNTPDLFCDSRSLITGGANVAGAPTVQCAHLLAGSSEPLP